LTWPFALAGLAVAVWPHRWTVLAWLVIAVAWIAIEWSATLERLDLEPRQQLLATAVDAARSDASRRGMPSPAIVGTSPWIAYFAQEQCRASGPSAVDRWRAAAPGLPVYVVVDTGYLGDGPERREIEAAGRLVYLDRLVGGDRFAVAVYAR